MTENDTKINNYYQTYFSEQDQTYYEPLHIMTKKLIKGKSLSKDQLKSIEWNITNEQKTILGYKCKKATSSFRGRTYIVWFTTEIPSKIYPWKLKGLPGAVLEFSTDNDEIFSGKAVQILLNQKTKVPTVIKSKFSTRKESQIINYRDYIKYDNRYLQDVKNKEIASYPNGTQLVEVPLRFTRLEKSFEWENEESESAKQ